MLLDSKNSNHIYYLSAYIGFMAFLSTILRELISCYWFLYGITLLRTKLHVFWIFNETFYWFQVVRFGSPVCKNCTSMFPDNKIATQTYLSEVWITCVDIREDVISISIKLHCSGALLPNAWFRSCLLCKHAVGVDRLYLPWHLWEELSWLFVSYLLCMAMVE